jgi:MtN3 and saliva related transmembrane protein
MSASTLIAAPLAAPREFLLHALLHGTTGLIGGIAAVLTTVALVPQILRIWERKSAEDVSLFMFLLYAVGLFLWLLYGIRLHAWPIIVANGVSLAGALVILGLKLRYDRAGSKE